MSLSFAHRHFGWNSEPTGFAAPPREAFDYHGTPGNDRIKASLVGDEIDVSQGGDDRVSARGGDDAIYFGAAFTGADRVNGGTGVDTVTLDGDYSAGVEVQADSFFKIEKLVLEGGSYALTGYLGFEYQGVTLINALALTSADTLNVHVQSLGKLTVYGGAGVNILDASGNPNEAILAGGDSADILTGGSGATTLWGLGGADTIIVGGAENIVRYTRQIDSLPKSYDTIENFGGSGAKIRFTFDSDTSTVDRDLDFHFNKTADRTGDILFKYDAGKDETIVKVFTDADHTADFVLHLTGDVPLTPADFVFG